MFDDQETHYPVPGETPWERLRYLATSTETIYPVPPYDLDALLESRSSWGLFRDRRPEYYGAITHRAQDSLTR